MSNNFIRLHYTNCILLALLPAVPPTEVVLSLNAHHAFRGKTQFPTWQHSLLFWLRDLTSQNQCCFPFKLANRCKQCCGEKFHWNINWHLLYCSMKKCTEPIQIHLPGAKRPKTEDQEQMVRIKRGMRSSLLGHVCGPLYWTPSLMLSHFWSPITVLRCVCMWTIYDFVLNCSGNNQKQFSVN